MMQSKDKEKLGKRYIECAASCAGTAYTTSCGSGLARRAQAFDKVEILNCCWPGHLMASKLSLPAEIQTRLFLSALSGIRSCEPGLPCDTPCIKPVA